MKQVFGFRQKHDLDMLQGFALPHPIRCIVDAGAGTGAAAISLAKLYPEAQVLTLEPHPGSFRKLVERTKAYPNITPIQAALSAIDHNTSLHERTDGNFTTIEFFKDERLPLVEEEVRCFCIETLMKDHNIKAIDLLHLDLGGSELPILMSAGRWADRVLAVVVKPHDHIMAGCMQAFDDATKNMVKQPNVGGLRFAISPLARLLS